MAIASKAAAVITIAIAEAAFEGIKAALPLGNTGYEPQRGASCEYFIWLDRRRATSRLPETILRPWRTRSC